MKRLSSIFRRQPVEPESASDYTTDELVNFRNAVGDPLSSSNIMPDIQNIISSYDVRDPINAVDELIQKRGEIIETFDDLFSPEGARRFVDKWLANPSNNLTILRHQNQAAQGNIEPIQNIIQRQYDTILEGLRDDIHARQDQIDIISAAAQPRPRVAPPPQDPNLVLQIDADNQGN